MSASFLSPSVHRRRRWTFAALSAAIAAGALWGVFAAANFAAAVVPALLGLAGLAVCAELHRQLAEQEAVARRLAATEARLGKLREAIDAHSIVAVTDAAGRILEVNDRFCAISGYAREELLGRTHKVVNSAEHSPEFFREMWATIRSGRVWRGEIVNRRKTGELYYLDSVIVPVLGADGKPERYIALRHDLTERRRAAAALEHMASVAQSTTAAVWTMSPDLRIEWVNSGFETLTGFVAPEALGKRTGELIHGPATSPKTVEYIDREMEAGRSFAIEIQHYHKSGRSYWGHTKVAPVHDRAGRLQRWVAVEQDITEIRQRNSLQAAVLASAAYSLIATDEQGCIQIFNHGAELLTGYQAEEVVRRTSPGILHDVDEVVRRAAELTAELRQPVAPGFDAFVAKARITGKPDENEWTYIRKDGSRVPVRLAVTAMRDPAGLITGYLGIAFDVTEQRRTLRDLQASEARLREAQQIAKIGSWEVDVPTKQMRWSEEAAMMLEVWPHTTASVDRALTLYSGTDRGRARAAMQSALELGVPMSFEATMRTLGGREIRVRVSARSESRDGKVLRVFGTTQDISELYAAESRQREISGRMEKIAAQVPGMVYQFKLRPDGTSCFPYASPGIRDIYHVEPEEVVEDASKVFARLHPADLESVAESIQRSARELTVWSCEYRVRYRDGSVHWLLGNATPERDSDGTIRWHGYICDITARKEVEEAQRRSEERFALIASATSDAVWDYDPSKGTIWWSEGITRLFGYDRPPPEDGVAWWLERVHPDEAAKVHASLATALESAALRWEEEYRFRHADGRWLVVLDRGLIVRDAQLRAVRAVGGMFDVSQRRESEALLKQLSERLHMATAVAHIGVWDTDLIAGTQVWDREAYALFGLDPAAGPPSYEVFRDLVHPADLERVAANWRQALESGDHLENEYRIVRPDGATRVIRALGSVHRDRSGRPVRVVGVNWDVTAEREAAAQVLAAKEQAEAATKAKSEFLANMSHEIRTPLNAVIGMSGLLLQTAPLSREQHEFAETIRTSGDTLLTLINDILDFSKIESGSLELEQQPFDLRDCVESALDLLGAKAAEKKLDLLYWIEPSTPTALEGDVTRLRQVLVNLVSNAVKFTARGEVYVGVAPVAGASGAGRVRLRLSVRDTGIGIPADRLDRLFKSFSQVDASTTRKFGGTGLGLAISKRLCELMGGRIWVESEVGRGTTFYCEVELRALEVCLLKRDSGAAGKLEGRRVLVVDDNATNRFILSRQLESWGLVPELFESGAAALAWCGRGVPCDLAIVDMCMPELDGVALTQQLHQLPARAGLPVVLLTSLGSLGNVPAAAGVAAQLAKPVRSSALLETIVAALGGGQRPAVAAPTIGSKVAEACPLSILLAEDNVTNQRVAQLLLARLGYRADVANNGLECLQALERQVYDVVLLDVQMPEMDGLTAAREIGRRLSPERRPYLVAMTANAMQGDRDDCLAAGMQDYVAKPVQLRDLETALRRAFAHCHGVEIG